MFKKSRIPWPYYVYSNTIALRYNQLLLNTDTTPMKEQLMEQACIVRCALEIQWMRGGLSLCCVLTAARPG